MCQIKLTARIALLAALCCISGPIVDIVEISSET